MHWGRHSQADIATTTKKKKLTTAGGHLSQSQTHDSAISTANQLMTKVERCTSVLTPHTYYNTSPYERRGALLASSVSAVELWWLSAVAPAQPGARIFKLVNLNQCSLWSSNMLTDGLSQLMSCPGPTSYCKCRSSFIINSAMQPGLMSTNPWRFKILTVRIPGLCRR